MTNFDRKIERLSKKNWEELRSFWLDHIPEIESPDQEPEDTLEHNERLRQESHLVEETGEHRFEADVRPASQLFHESIFTICKAVRVSCEAARQAANGLPTWSISTAHHSTMFALRAFLGLCGIAYLEINNRHFLMDVQPSQPKGQRQKRRLLPPADNRILLIRVKKPMQHREWWSVYQRILRTSARNFSCWRYPVDTELAQCGSSVLSRHRNDLHYRLKWFHDDLLEESPIPSFGLFSDKAAEKIVEKLGENDGSDGVHILNQVLLGNSLAMLEDLSKLSPRVKEVVDAINGTIEQLTNDVVASWYPR